VIGLPQAVAPDYLAIDAWRPAPTAESPEEGGRRFDNLLTLPQTGWLCRFKYAMKRAQPVDDDKLQMPAFWRPWHTLLTRTQAAEA
jgi:hypothetical protein